MSASPVSAKRPSRRKLAGGIAAVLALSASAAAHAASTWYVNDCTDGTAAGQFRWATNGAGSGDTIDLTTLLTPAGYPNCFNYATSGGFNHSLGVSSTVTVATGVTIVGPPASTHDYLDLFGGYSRQILHTGANVAIQDLGFLGGSATIGGCVYAAGNITLTNVKTYKCYAYYSGGSTGGGAMVVAGKATLTGSTIDKAQAKSVSGSVFGGAIYAAAGATLTNSTITNSTATTSTGSALGGGIFNAGASSGKLNLYSSSVTGTASVTGAAGGHAYGGATSSGYTTYLKASYAKGTATTQSAGAARGGSIYSVGNAELVNSNAMFGNAYSRSGVSRGGNLYTKGSATIKYSSIQLGSAQRGGGVYANTGFSAKYSAVHGNSASNGGGGVINTGGSTTIRGTTVSFNSGLGWSGLDLFAGGSTSITIENSTIVHNSGSSGNGAMYLRSHHTTLDNSTVAYNSSPASTPAVYMGAGSAGSTIDMHSTLISSNAAGSGFSDLSASPSAPFSVSSSNNFVRSPASGVPSGTIVGKCPLLREVYSSGGWAFFMQRPAMKSPAIDAGSNPDSLTADQRGGNMSATTPPRASGPGPGNSSPIPDIGAYEVDQDDIIFDGHFDGCP